MGESSKARREDHRLLRGQGAFVADRVPKGALFAGFVRADMASGRIVALDISDAQAMAGVVAVFTGDDLAADGVADLGHADLPRDDGGTPGSYPQPILCRDWIRHAGEPAALVIARSAAALADAMDAVVVEVEDAARLSGVAFCKSLGDAGAVAKAMAGAAHRFGVDIAAPRVTAMALEPRGMIVTPAGEGLRIIASTQNPFALRTQIAAHFGWDAAAIHVEAQDVGGSFGLKGYMTREDAALVWAARKVGAVLVWLSTRSEAMLGDAQGRGATGRIDLGFDAGLRIVALRAAFEIDAGAYPDRRAFGVMNNANGLTGMYDIPCVSALFTGHLSARAPLAPFRGNGRPEASLAIEMALDQAARALGVEPGDLRRRNLIGAAAFPVTTGFGAVLDCGDFAAVMDAAEVLGGGAAERRAAAGARGLLYGVGLANCIESAGGPLRAPRPDHARLTVDEGGRVLVAPGVMAVGQGHETGMSALVAARLGLAPDLVDYRNGDTDAVTDGRGMGGSAGLCVAGAAVWMAMEQLIAEGAVTAARLLGCAEAEVSYRDGAFHREGSNESVSLGELAADAGGIWVVEASFTPPAATFPNGTHICEVEIDPETGVVRIVRYTGAEDIGRVLNPMLVEGQLHGGIAQGLSTGLGEQMVHDEAGQVLTGSLMDYQVVRAADLPMFSLATVEVPTALNPLGVKGVGEAGTVGATAAFGLAVGDALARAGVTEFQLPATPLRVWQALQGAV